MVLMGRQDTFKAPKFGIYHFLYESLLGIRGNGTSVCIYMNDVIFVNALSSISQQDPKKMSLQVTLKLTVGDSVCFKAKIRDNISTKVLDRTRDFVIETVKGFLLKQTMFF